MAKKQSTLRIVDSLAEITRHHDRSILEKSMLKTIDDVFPNGLLRLYRVEEYNEKPVATLLTYLEDGFADCSAKHANSSKALIAALEEVIKTGDVVSVESAERPELWENIFPAFDAQNEIFAVCVYTGPQLSYNDQRLIHGILKVYSNYLALLDKTERDKLTGLYNRETLDEELTKSIINHQLGESTSHNLNEEAFGRKATTSAYLCVIDIDHFKAINDSFGHLYGDEILVLIARFLKDEFTRKEDLVYRYGGEEFVVLIGSNSPEDTLKTFERVRKNIAKHDFPQLDRVTVSMGVVAVNGQMTPADIIGQADKALYYAKENGRNRVCDYNDLVAQGALDNGDESKPLDISFF